MILTLVEGEVGGRGDIQRRWQHDIFSDGVEELACRVYGKGCGYSVCLLGFEQ